MLPYLYKKPANSRYNFHQLNVNNDLPEILKVCDSFKPDAVVNFAAQGEVRNSWQWPEDWYETNCLAVVRLSTELAKRNYLKRYVAISTPEVYGSTARGLKECHEYAPSTPYGASKLAGDLHLMALHKRHGFPVVFTRAANLYGIHQQLYRIIPRTVIYAKMGRVITLHGGGKAERAFIHARDVADATWQVLQRGCNGEVYHLSPQNELRTIHSVVKLVLKKAGADFEDMVVLQEENYGQDERFSIDGSKMAMELGWQPRVRFEDGVSETVEWIDENWNDIAKRELAYVHLR